VGVRFRQKELGGSLHYNLHSFYSELVGTPRPLFVVLLVQLLLLAVLAVYLFGCSCCTTQTSPPGTSPRHCAGLSPTIMRLSTTLLLLLSTASAAPAASSSNITTWHVVWTGGQSNSVGTNTQTSGYPTWPSSPQLQMFCWGGQRGCTKGTFLPASAPLVNEDNVGFSQTYGNLLLQTLPATEGVILVNTGVGGTGFHDGNWDAPSGPLAVRSVAVMQQLAAALPATLGGNLSLHSMLFHQGELDAGDSRQDYHADYCTYLQADVSALIDFFRASFPGASPSTPFINGGLLPYWEDIAPNTTGVVQAISALNTSRACTGTADSRVFPDFLPGGIPNGDPKARSGASGDVIHFTATQAFFMGFQYWSAFARAAVLTSVVPSAQTQACGAPVQPAVAKCG
jgi:hypothetical protein